MLTYDTQAFAVSFGPSQGPSFRGIAEVHYGTNAFGRETPQILCA